MSEATADATRLPSVDVRSRPLTVIAGVAFWGWLVVRWSNDYLLPDGVGVPKGEPFFSPAPFTNLQSALLDFADALGVIGFPVNWLAGVVGFVAGAIPWMPELAEGAWLTVVLTVSGIAFGFVLAVPLSVARVYGTRWMRALSLGYTELIRGTPLLAQLFVLYFGTGLTTFIRELPAVGQGMVPAQAVWVAIIGFTINSAAYQAEYIRSALESVEAGQLTAARSIGLSKIDGIRYVVLPQGLRYAIPGWSNELIYLIKYSSLAAFITVRELFFRAEAIATETYRFTELFILAALMYLALVVSASILMNAVESYTSIPGLGQKGRRST